VKKDGSIEYSQDVPVGSNLKGKILIFPTPAFFSVTVAYEVLQNNATAQLYAADGKLIKNISAFCRIIANNS